MSNLDLPNKKIDLKNYVNCFRAVVSDKKHYMAYYLNEIHISIRDNIHENFKNLVTFFAIFLVF